jgi:hypothetical protein
MLTIADTLVSSKSLSRNKSDFWTRGRRCNVAAYGLRQRPKLEAAKLEAAKLEANKQQGAESCC